MHYGEVEKKQLGAETQIETAWLLQLHEESQSAIYNFPHEFILLQHFKIS